MYMNIKTNEDKATRNRGLNNRNCLMVEGNQ